MARFRFKAYPPGSRYGWKGEIHASHPVSGELETDDEAFAAALRERAKTQSIVEISEPPAEAEWPEFPSRHRGGTPLGPEGIPPIPPVSEEEDTDDEEEGEGRVEQHAGQDSAGLPGAGVSGELAEQPAEDGILERGEREHGAEQPGVSRGVKPHKGKGKK